MNLQRCRLYGDIIWNALYVTIVREHEDWYGCVFRQIFLGKVVVPAALALAWGAPQPKKAI